VPQQRPRWTGGGRSGELLEREKLFQVGSLAAEDKEALRLKFVCQEFEAY
jgi:hypothetical protein